MNGITQFRQKKAAWLSWLYREPTAPESRLPRLLRAPCRIAIVSWREFWRDNILLRASALTFAVILAIVPVLALSTAVLKGLGAGDQMRGAAHQFISSLAVEMVQEADLAGEAPEAAAPRTEQQILDQTFYHHLSRAVDTIFDYVDGTNFATLGIMGMIGLFITVISLLATIEDSMNAVWDARAGRPLRRKVMDYLALILLLPLAVNIAMAVLAAFQSAPASRMVEQLFPVALVGQLLVNLLIFGLLAATLTICYRFLPNSRVNFRPALIGGIIGGIAWLLLQSLYINLQLGVSRYNAIYGSFATLPLFLLWVYSSWVIFLAGAEISFAAQHWRRYLPHREKLSPGLHLALAFDLLTAVYDDFHNRRTPSDLASLARRIGFSEPDTGKVAADLLAAGYLRQVENKPAGLIPVTGADRVKAAELMDAFWGPALPASAGGRLVAEILAGGKAMVADRTLRDFEPAASGSEEAKP
jgi:membrane protein